MDFYEAVNNRRSIRAFQGTPVPEDALQRIMEAARLAPSACNKQPWHFYVIRDEALKAELVGTRQPWAATAPVVIVACSIPGIAWVRSFDEKNHADIDIAITAEHIILAAAAEGLATCWVCSFDPKVARRVLEIPAEWEPAIIIPLGYAAAEAGATTRKRLGETVTWR